MKFLVDALDPFELLIFPITEVIDVADDSVQSLWNASGNKGVIRTAESGTDVDEVILTG